MEVVEGLYINEIAVPAFFRLEGCACVHVYMCAMRILYQL